MESTYNVSGTDTANLFDFLVIDLWDLVSSYLASIDPSYVWNIVIHDL